MATLTIAGSSNDVIDVEGAISEEFTYTADNPEGDLLAFSDGTLLQIRYSNSGIWRITVLLKGSGVLDIETCSELEGDSYTDRAVLIGDVSWVVHGIGYAN